MNNINAKASSLFIRLAIFSLEFADEIDEIEK